MPMPAGLYADLSPARPESSTTAARTRPTPTRRRRVYRYDLEKRKEDTLLDKADGFALSADAKRALVRVKDDWHVVDVADKLDLAKFKLDVDRIQVKVDPPAEWAQMLRRGVADQPRLLLRPGLPRRRLERDAREVRGVPAAPRERGTTCSA